MATVCGLQLLCGLAKRVGNTRVAVMIYVLQGNEAENEGWLKPNSYLMRGQLQQEKGNKQGACRAAAKGR